MISKELNSAEQGLWYQTFLAMYAFNTDIYTRAGISMDPYTFSDIRDMREHSSLEHVTRLVTENTDDGIRDSLKTMCINVVNHLNAEVNND